MRGKSITVRLYEHHMARADGLFQWDKGQRLFLQGVKLPSVYEVHFSNTFKGEAISHMCSAEGTLIPDELLETGKDVYFWIYVRPDEFSGETEYDAVIHVTPRPEPADVEPSEEEATIIGQAIAALNNAIDTTTGIVEEVSEARDETISARESAQESQVRAEESAEVSAAAMNRAQQAQIASEEARDEAIEAASDAGVALAQTISTRDETFSARDEAQQYASNAEHSADRAEQVANYSGFMEMFVDKNGRLIYLRTDNADADFSFDEDGHLILEWA